MIVTVTPNPSLDRTVRIPALRRGAVLRAVAPAVLDPSGKGVNVSRALHAAGRDTLAVFPAGGRTGTALTDLLAAEGIAHRAVPTAAETRSNVSVVEPSGVVTKLNEPGAPLAPQEIEALVEAACQVARTADWVVLCGSLPPETPETFYVDLIGRLRETAARVALDTSGPALRKGIAATPDLIKPNRHELQELLGRPIETLGAAADAAAELRASGIGAVLASLGPDGALLAGEDVRWGTASVDEVRSAVGAGDALLAGFLAGGGSLAVAPAADDSPAGASVAGDSPAVARAAGGSLTEALAWAAAACALPGTAMPRPGDIRRDIVTVHDGVDRTRPLTPE